MLVPVRWLGEWIDLPDSLEELAEQLTMGGLEVDGIERGGPDLSAIRVGKVVECGRHPNADRLSLCKVDLGDGEELRPIVCGAPNVAAGQKVAVAVPGTLLPDGTRLKKSKIRGETSLGMICSERELGLSEEHEGILVLETEAPLGTPVDQVLGAADAVLEIAILANRGDCTSLLGVAREVRAHRGGELRVPETLPPEGSRAAAEDIRVAIGDPEGCYRYAARIVRGVTVGPSPAWLCRKLEAAGLRPINNVVDVTNLVLMEFGQPLHAFDLAKLRGGVVEVRRARAGEALRTLDGEERKLEPDDLVIADAEGAIALAGVMGGLDSQVSDATTDILIESAHFDPKRIRRSARRLNLATDASYRFEREVDAAGIDRAANRAARLIAEVAGGQVSAGIVDAAGSPPERVAEVALAPARVNRLLGTDLSADQITAYLERLEIRRVAERGEELLFAVPTFRNDITIPEDLIEEVARIHGFADMPRHRQAATLREGTLPVSWHLTAICSDVLRDEGLVEVQSFPFMDPQDLDRLGLDAGDPRRQTTGILNPIVESHSRMRSLLVPTLLGIARENLNRQADVVRLFEVARAFRGTGSRALPEESLYVTFLITQASEKTLWEDPETPLFFVAKGMAERLLQALERDLGFRDGAKEPYLHPGATIGICDGKRRVGVVGELHPDTARQFGIEVPCALLELDLSAVSEMPTRPLKYRDVSRFPHMRRDLAVLLDEDQRAGEVLEAIRRKAGSHLIEVEIFDRYAGKGVPEGKVSLAFRLTFQRPDRTLTEAEVSKATDRVVQMLGKRFGGELR